MTAPLSFLGYLAAFYVAVWASWDLVDSFCIGVMVGALVGFVAEVRDV